MGTKVPPEAAAVPPMHSRCKNSALTRSGVSFCVPTLRYISSRATQNLPLVGFSAGLPFFYLATLPPLPLRRLSPCRAHAAPLSLSPVSASRPRAMQKPAKMPLFVIHTLPDL